MNILIFLLIVGLVFIIPIAYVSGYKKAVKIMYEQHGITNGKS